MPGHYLDALLDEALTLAGDGEPQRIAPPAKPEETLDLDALLDEALEKAYPIRVAPKGPLRPDQLAEPNRVFAKDEEQAKIFRRQRFEREQQTKRDEQERFRQEAQDFQETIPGGAVGRTIAAGLGQGLAMAEDAGHFIGGGRPSLGQRDSMEQIAASVDPSLIAKLGRGAISSMVLMLGGGLFGRGAAALSAAGAARSVAPGALRSIGAAGQAGAITTFAASEAASALKEGREAGLQGSELRNFALRSGVIEALPAAAFSAVGLGGMEKLAGLRGAASGGLREGFKQAGFRTIQEIPEELITEAGHSFNRGLSGVDPDALTAESLTGMATTTVLQTVATMGLMEAIHIPASVRRSRAYQQALKNLALSPDGAKALAESKPEAAGALAAQAQPSRQALEAAGLGELRLSRSERERLSSLLRDQDTRTQETADAEGRRIPTQEGGEDGSQTGAQEGLSQDFRAESEAAFVQEALEGAQEAPGATISSGVAQEGAPRTDVASVASAESQATAVAEQEAPTPQTVLERAAGERSPDGTTSARQVDVNADREALGLTTINSKDRRSWEQAVGQAREQDIPARALRIAQEIQAAPRALSDVETAGMVQRAAALKAEHKAQAQAITAADEAQTRLIGAEMQRIEQEFDQLSEALYLSGSEKGRALAAQKLTLNEDFDLVTVISRAKAVRGKDLSPAQRAQFQRLTQQLQETEARLGVAQKQIQEARVNDTIKTTARKPRRGRPKVAPDKSIDDLFADAERLLKAGCDRT